MRSAHAMNRPTLADRARFESALRARLGAAVVPIQGGASSHAAQAILPLISSFVVGALVIGGALLLAPRQDPQAEASAPAPVTQTAPAVPTASFPEAEPEPAPVASSAVSVAAVAPTSAVAPIPPPKPDRLAEEVTLLSSAVSDLRAGRVSVALKTLDEHRRRFPSGILTEERCAARAQALCALGRQREAQAELDRLAPRSLAAARARQICDLTAARDR
jgi:hypothetical protein